MVCCCFRRLLYISSFTKLLLRGVPYLQLRRINAASFPVLYNEAFYKDIIRVNNASLNKFAYYKGVVVGAACARLEEMENESSKRGDDDDDNNNVNETTTTTATSSTTITEQQQQQPRKRRLYIMTLAVLAAYRGRGVGSQLLESLLEFCRQDSKIGGISEIALHVQISNQDAIRFYTDKKFGFVQGELVENYYRRINPPHCYLLYKKLGNTRSANDSKQADSYKDEE